MPTVTYEQQDSHGSHTVTVEVDHTEESNHFIPTTTLYDANDNEIDRVATDHIIKVEE